MNLLLNAANGGFGQDLTTLFVYSLIVVSIPVLVIILSYVTGQRHMERTTDEPYESGVRVTDSARLRFSSHFYLVAMLFVIFDLEVVFIIAWAVAFESVGWYGFIGAAVFIFILTVVLIYEWAIGALDFGPQNKSILRAYKKLGQDKLPEHVK